MIILIFFFILQLSSDQRNTSDDAEFRDPLLYTGSDSDEGK